MINQYQKLIKNLIFSKFDKWVGMIFNKKLKCLLILIKKIEKNRIKNYFLNLRYKKSIIKSKLMNLYLI